MKSGKAGGDPSSESHSLFEKVSEVPAMLCSCAVAYDPLDPTGNVTVKWDIMSWNADGYVAVVTMNNFQMYHPIMSPGWTLGWTWARIEAIWAAVGARLLIKGDCSKFKSNIPHSCKENPTVVDLLPGVPEIQKIANCCKAGVLPSWGQDPSAAISAFQLSVGLADTTNRTVKLPQNFTLLDDTDMFYGKKFYNDILMQAGPDGNVHSDLILQKDKNTLAWKRGWAFPRRVYFNAAFDPLDPFGNITIKWDVMSWTADGYVASVTMNNFQMYRHIMNPGWTLGWGWAKKEVIWSMVGAQTTEQGDCSKFKANIPHCCKRNPIVVDLLPGVPYNQQFSNCCKGGVVASWGQDPAAAVSAFQVSVGQAGTSNKTVKLPKNFTLLGPGPGYTCGPAKVVPSTVFLTPDRRRKTQAQNDTGMFYGMKFYNDLLMEAGPSGNVQSEPIKRTKHWCLSGVWTGEQFAAAGAMEEVHKRKETAGEERPNLSFESLGLLRASNYLLTSQDAPKTSCT
ncbi:hypothetical protein RJ639_038157 [Escallonia herrerae]|uniref:Uncharacterized protein n=1 Tax=Escallonia herrerae TaxID=1293975 RepID=A0AA88WNZ6_9ASTE|nr:hypothetical protein RJ639_038157 [Escallonia herrerae]